MRAIDYGQTCIVLYTNERDTFLDWISCMVQDWESPSELGPLVVQFVNTLFDNEVRIMMTGSQALSVGKRRQIRTITGWDVIIKDLPFLQSDMRRRHARHDLAKKLWGKGLQLFGHKTPRKWHPELLKRTFLQSTGR